MLTNKQIVSRLKKAKNIAIFAHRDPDPDACGAMFGLREFCRAIGKEATVFAKKTEPNYLHHIFPMDEVREDFVAENFDLIVLVDIHAFGRTEKIFHERLAQCDNVLIIDHHKINEREGVASEEYRIEEVASCSQMIADLFKEIGVKPNEDCATYIYAGIMGDTDRFLHDNLTKEVFEYAMFLLECGANIQHVYNFLYRYKTQEQLIVNKFFLDNLQFLENGRAGYIIVTQKCMKRLGVGLEEVKSFSNLIVTIKDVEVSFLCYEREKGVFKFSMRSRRVDTSAFAVKYGGGGHKCASGFELKTSPREIKKKIKRWAKEILNG